MIFQNITGFVHQIILFFYDTYYNTKSKFHIAFTYVRFPETTQKFKKNLKRLLKTYIYSKSVFIFKIILSVILDGLKILFIQ